MESKYFHEIKAIIQNDLLQSTYKLALLRAIIEIARDSANDKIHLNEFSIYPFSQLQRRVLTYYYPLFAYPSFIPQMYTESAFPNTKRQLVLRKSMSPIVHYYNSNGGFEQFLSDLENDKVPEKLGSDYFRLLETVRKTFIEQPMKYLGNSLRFEGYTVVQYLEQLPYSDSMTSPADPAGYYAIPDEYARIFEDPACAQHLLDLVIQRWIEYTLGLSDDLTAEGVYDLLLFMTGVENPQPQPALDPLGTPSQPASCFKWCDKIFALMDGQGDQVSMIQTLEEKIRAEYEQFSSLRNKIKNLNDCVRETVLKIQNIDGSIRQIGAVYGISSPENTTQDVFKVLSDYFAEQMAVREVYSDAMGRVSRSEQEIAGLQREKDELRQMIQKAEDEIAVRERQGLLIEQYRRKIALFDYNIKTQPRPFGYVDKPIARFLTYCDDVTVDILRRCIRLISDPAETRTVKPDLPIWFIEEFDTWWAAKQKSPREGDSSKPYSQKPFLTFDLKNYDILLVVPSQTIDYIDGISEVSLIIRDDSQILHEGKLPLYREKEGLNTKEFKLQVDHPSSNYYVEFSINQSVPMSWRVDGFSGSNSSYFFDYDTGRRIEQKLPSSRKFILIAPKNKTITPETAVDLSGNLSGDWYNFQYYVIDPVDDLYIGDAPFQADRRSTKLDLHIDPERFDRYLNVDGWKVVLGPPPALRISFESLEILSETYLSIHPHDQYSNSMFAFYRLTDLRDGVEIDAERSLCIVDLSHPTLLGKERAGAFTIRLRNEICRTDVRVKCAFLPDISYRFSKPLFLPAEGASRVQLEVDCPHSVTFEPEGDVRLEHTGTGFLVTSKLEPTIKGKIEYPREDGTTFEGVLSFSVPHVAWRFEDERGEKVYPVLRSVIQISETDYQSCGKDLALRIFLPRYFNSMKATISTFPLNQSIPGRITNGQGYFPLAKFNDTLRLANEDIVRFEFTMNDPNGEDITFPLFILHYWRIHLLQSPRVSTDPSGNRVIEITWEESGTAGKRFIILWREKVSGEVSREYFGKIPDSARAYRIQGDRETLPLPPGQYCVQFYSIRDEWDSLPEAFPGEKSRNVFRFSYEKEQVRAPQASVDARIEHLISEIETCVAERCISAIDEFKKNHQVRILGYQLSRDRPELHERFQAALLNVISNTKMPPDLRSVSVELLGNTFSRSTEHALIRVLLDDSTSPKPLRIAILKSLHHGITEERISTLVASLKDSDPEIRGEAVTSLGLTAQVTAQDHVTESLLPLLDDESVLVQRRVAAALGKTRSRKALTPLSSISFDRSRDRVLRITAIESLARLGLDKEIVQRLQDLSKDESEYKEIQKIALSVLSGLEWLDDEAKKRQTGILIDEMRSGTHERRISTIKQLSKFSNRVAINALMEAAGDESADVRKASAESLREINTPISIPVLIPLLDDPDKEVAEIAESACKNLLRGLLYNIKLDEEKREAAAAHLAKMGAVAVDPLLDMLRDVENIQSERATPIEIQKSVVNALSRMTDPSAVKILCRALEDANSDVVWGAAKALGNIGDASAIEALDKALRKYSQMLKKDLGLTYVSNVLKEARSKLKSRENEFKR